MAGPDELVRVVAQPGGGLAVGRALPGRGAWLCAWSPGCVEQAQRRRAFSRALRSEVQAEAVQALAEALGERARIEGCGVRSRED